MTSISSRTARLLLAAVLALTGLLGVPTASSLAGPALPGSALPGAVLAGSALPESPLAGAAAAPPCGDVSSYPQVDLSRLPREATDTVNLIKKGGPYPYPKDGTVWDNRERTLPDCGSGYYHEYTVPTPGSPDRGARRFVVGNHGEYFYTGDHYDSFALTHVDR